MAVYSKLLLSVGGGIVSPAQQAEQIKNTATILIGLGGTGIDCLRTIKTQIYSRLKADDPDADVPRYEHIRFLGIDTTGRICGSTEGLDNLKTGPLMALDDTEFFSISNPNVKRVFSHPRALEMCDELSWLKMCSACALPLSSYSQCSEYEALCFCNAGSGRYSYEGKDLPGMTFNDWRELSPLTPQSLLALDRAPHRIQDMVGAAQTLFDEANQMGIFDDNYRICAPDENGVKALQALIEQSRTMAPHLSGATGTATAAELIAQLKAAKDLPLAATEYGLRNAGNFWDKYARLRIRKDYFVAAPAYHAVVRDIMTNIKAQKAAADDAIRLLEDAISRTGEHNPQDA